MHVCKGKILKRYKSVSGPIHFEIYIYIYIIIIIIIIYNLVCNIYKERVLIIGFRVYVHLIFDSVDT